MRIEFAKQVEKLSSNKKQIFLSGDLGFMALEDVRDSYGERFINCGVSEQNMIGVAAGLAKSGFKVFAYSIAPFIYARPFEQIRNDIVFHNLPVCLVGNGGGYAYGYMGPTHHALEDCGVMNSLGVRVVAPIFDNDIKIILKSIHSPTYLRLGYQVAPSNVEIPPYKSWRMLENNDSNNIFIGFGPMAGLLWETIHNLSKEERPCLWGVSEFSRDIPDTFLDQIENKSLFIYEEHIENSGIAMHISHILQKKGIRIKTIKNFSAHGYPKNTFGSQDYHRQKSRLDKESIIKLIKEINDKQ
ncbi:MAG: transketolase [Gammaproteobacteria bacterium]|nr:transketolase [Gammaproteobacteria bacterium]|tara:strand:+ start:204 stop:1103 length:900 start_codon:yes stop_codon:yes gene_type:complete